MQADIERAREDARAARAQLAAEVRAMGEAACGSATAFYDAVAARYGLSPLTVRNALSERHTMAVLARCVEWLAEARTSSPHPAH